MPSDHQPSPGPPSKPGKERANLTRSSKVKDSSGSQGAKMAGGSSTCQKPPRPASDTEKDSGFSDVSSEYLSTVEQTDTEDQPAKVQKAPGGLTGLTPIYIVKNVILKQPLDICPTSQFLAWNSQHLLDSTHGSPVLFIQQPAAALKPLLPGRKSTVKEKYLPILSAYPKIAPHPGRDPQAKAEAGLTLSSGRGSKNKRFCLEETWGSSSELAALKGGNETQQEEAPLPLPLPQPQPASPGQQATEDSGKALLSQNTAASSNSSTLPKLDQAEGWMVAKASKKLALSSLGKQRRFHNTVEILRRSGLLGITLRTKELIRQNNSTQRELAELRDHTRLLCEAVQSNDSEAWSRLQKAVSNSAVYWANKGASSGAHVGRSLAPSVEGAKDPPACSPVNLSLTPDSSVLP